MTKQNEEHLTTEQLSALLDKQLSSQEQAIVDAHLQTCQQCQLTLADLRQTIALLHALPQLEVPRSFTLPTRLAIVQEQPAPNTPVVTPPAGVGRRDQIYRVPGGAVPDSPRRIEKRRKNLQLAFRAVSSLAAVLGLIFILSSFATALPHGGASNTASSGSSSTPVPRATTHNSTAPSQRPTTVTGTPPGGVGSPSVSGAQTPTAISTPPQVVKPAPTRSTGPPSQPAPAIIDLSTPSSHLVIGSALLVLGILGFALTRRR